MCFSTALNLLSYTKFHWIIDTGATRHICSNKSMFATLHSIAKIHVTLPNGVRLDVFYPGDVKINNDITLHNVLYIPEFKFNLIFISCLLSHAKCDALFCKDNFVIQEHHTGR